MLDIKQKFSLIDTLIWKKNDLQEFLKKIPEKDTIYDLTQKGILAVIKKDAMYLNLCSSKINRISPWVLGAVYCEGTNYLFGGLAVYNLYGFTTQIANQYTIYSDTFYGEKNIYKADFFFKKVKPDLLYGGARKMEKGIFYQIMTPERAFIEFCKENPEKLSDLRTIYAGLDQKKLLSLLKNYPYQTTRNFIQKEIILGK